MIPSMGWKFTKEVMTRILITDVVGKNLNANGDALHDIMESQTGVEFSKRSNDQNLDFRLHSFCRIGLLAFAEKMKMNFMAFLACWHRIAKKKSYIEWLLMGQEKKTIIVAFMSV